VYFLNIYVSYFLYTYFSRKEWSKLYLENCVLVLDDFLFYTGGSSVLRQQELDPK
jgi:hypothetical protein